MLIELTPEQARLLKANWPDAPVDGQSFTPSAVVRPAQDRPREYIPRSLRSALRPPPLGDAVAVLLRWSGVHAAVRLLTLRRWPAASPQTTCHCAARQSLLNRHTARIEAALWILFLALILFALHRPR